MIDHLRLRLSLLLLFLGAVAGPGGLLRPVTLEAQAGLVGGTVADRNTLQPLSGAQILVEGTNLGALTNEAGRFLIRGVAGTEVTLQVILMGFGTERLNPMLSVSMYFTFVARLCFTFGLVFQLPIVVFLLSILGIVTPQFLLKQWRYAVVVIFVASAILTPPDPASQVLMAIPILLLYIGSVLVAFAALRKQKKAESEELEG